MVHFRCLAVAVALCYEVNAGPCRPRSSSGIATTSSTELTDNPASPSDTTLAYGSSVSTDPSSPASTSALFSSVEEVPSSDTSATSAAAITTVLLTETAVSLTLSNTPDFKPLTTSATTLASYSTSDGTFTSAETYSQTTEQTWTPTSHAASLSEDISSVATSNQASAGTETSTAETTSYETSTVGSSTGIETRTKTINIETTTAEMTTAQESTASTTEEALTTTTTTAEPNEPTNYFINGGFEIPDESGEYTGAPSLLGRSVTIKTDSSKALSGSHYAEVAFPLVGSGSAAYAIRQSIAGLDPAKRYAYTYNYAPADMVASGAPPNPIIKFTTMFGTKAYETDFSGEVSPQDSYVKRKIVFDGITSSFVQTQVQFSGLNRGSVRFDDISIFEYDPPCTLVSPAPSDKWCSRKGSVYGASNQQKTIGLTQSLSLEDCAQSCHLEPTCQVISYVPTVGNNIGRCWRYKVPREDIEYVQNGGGQIAYEPGCFSFKE
ncbi:hypothetical protein FOC4_g10000688 [Fusarium odoratissimum]|uniref:Apple domain-containing protein n=1 Tax=Fusarium oxysporum f. sp. cubense (strain race 4) TaxID=2502994 RepID=N1RQ00_FUSC4|nr:hypothetical protein FOC4_g10000688 [Fusarium odoratissimum]